MHTYINNITLKNNLLDEDYQVLPGNEHIHFDEREIVSEGLKLLD